MNEIEALNNFLKENRVWVVFSLTAPNTLVINFNKYISEAKMLAENDFTEVRIVFYDKEYKTVKLNMTFINGELNITVHLGYQEEKELKLKGVEPVGLHVKSNTAQLTLKVATP